MASFHKVIVQKNLINKQKQSAQEISYQLIIIFPVDVLMCSYKEKRKNAMLLVL